MSNLEVMIFGALIVFFLIVEPKGLARLWQTGKEKLRLWPFRLILRRRCGTVGMAGETCYWPLTPLRVWPILGDSDEIAKIVLREF